MAKIDFLYPDWKKKALTFSYDDGRIYDRRLIGIFNKYGLKGTFHLNTHSIGTEGYVTAEEIPELYRGQEIACHGTEHKHPVLLCTEQRISEIWNDRIGLERITGRIINGFSYAFGEYSDEFIQTAVSSGIRYARTTCSSGSFKVPADFMQWNPTMHHSEGILEKLEEFLHIPEYEQMPLFYIWGHSFEFGEKQDWKLMETFAERAASDREIWYASNGQIYEYIQAIHNLQMSADLSRIYNPSAISVYYTIEGIQLVCRPGEKKMLNKNNIFRKNRIEKKL